LVYMFFNSSIFLRHQTMDEVQKYNAFSKLLSSLTPKQHALGLGGNAYTFLI